MNVHTPERQPTETFSDYKARRADSHWIASRMTTPPAPIFSFKLHKASAEKRNRRDAIKAAGGIRQFKRFRRIIAAH